MKQGNDNKRIMNKKTEKHCKTDGRMNSVFYYFKVPVLFNVYLCSYVFLAVNFITQCINLSTRIHANKLNSS